MRAYLAPFAEPYAGPGGGAPRPRLALDLDEADSRALARVSALRRARGDGALAGFEAAEAAKHALLEAAWLPRFDRILVASAPERDHLAATYPQVLADVVPNAVRVPARAGRRPRAGALELLFVGSLGYFPNEDAALFLCHDILPRLRRLAPEATARVVGSLPGPAVRALAALPGVRVQAAVPSVAPLYATATVAIVPLRAGGGTRIKILEAFARRVPVVATPLAAEGLDVEDGTHLLLADDAAGLAAACARLADDAALARRLVEQGLAFVRSRHAQPIVARAIRRLCGPAPAARARR
jgi:glycosyltransferase involved in cell wall biosynthesis